MWRALALLLLLASAFHAGAQQHVLAVEAGTELPRKWRGPFKLDSAEVERRTAELRWVMVGQGYLAASFDSCITANDTTRCFLHLGDQYRWARLSAGNLPQEIASATGFRERFYPDRPVTPRQVAQLLENLLAACENNGFPFATAGLDSLRMDADGLHAAVNLEKGRFVTLDSLVVKGSARISPRFLQAQIGIKPGDAYNEALVRRVDDRARELPFVATKHPAYLMFTPEHTKLYLFLDAKPASSFNGIIGIAQDPVDGRVRLTGDLDLKLRNAMHRGEAVHLNWRSLQDRTQDLKAGFNMPFLFNTPFGTDLGLKIFKRDTSFLEVSSRAALEYPLGLGDKLRVFVNSKSSKRLGQLSSFLPGTADIRLTSYGIGVRRERFDYLFNPRKGLSLDLEGAAGNKHTSSASLTDTVDTQHTSLQLDLNGQLAWHIPLGKRATLRLAAQGGSMVNEELHANELYRIGGVKSQRGVDEASIYCSSYAIGTVEYRFLFEENSNLFLFVDQGWWEDQSRTDLLTDTPIGFGAGTSFETKAGIFSLSYALGRQFDNPVELRNGKVHFGFTSLF